MTMMAPTNRRTAGGGTVRSGSSLPVASEPIDPTKSLINKPRIEPLASPTTPVPTPSQPKAPPAVAPEQRPSTQPVGPTTQAPAAPSTPSPYQTNDPLAFTPPSVTPTPQAPPPTAPPVSAPTTVPDVVQPPPIITETAESFLPPDLTAPQASANVAVPDDVQAPVPTMANGTPAYSLTPTDPGTALTNSTITPGPGVDRYAIANDLLSQWDAASQPQFDRQIRDLAQNAAARGQVGSGMTRGAFADASRDYQTQRTNAQRGFLTDALTGSIDDAYKNIGIAQQQQGFQAQQGQNAFTNQVTLQQLADSEQGQFFQQQMAALGFNADQIQQAFENAYRVQQLSDDETGQAFTRAMQQFILGNQGDPTELYQWLAQLYALPQATG
jgi:hypothetical protein